MAVSRQLPALRPLSLLPALKKSTANTATQTDWVSWYWEGATGNIVKEGPSSSDGGAATESQVSGAVTAIASQLDQAVMETTTTAPGPSPTHHTPCRNEPFIIVALALSPISSANSEGEADDCIYVHVHCNKG